MTQIRAGHLALFLKYCQLVRQRKWHAAYELIGWLELNFEPENLGQQFPISSLKAG